MDDPLLCSFLTWSMWKFFGQNLHLCHVEREIDGFPRVGIQELLGLKCVTNPPLCWRFLWTLCHNGVKLFLKEHYIFCHLIHDTYFPNFHSRIKKRYPSSFWSKDIDQLFFHLLQWAKSWLMLFEKLGRYSVLIIIHVSWISLKNFISRKKKCTSKICFTPLYSAQLGAYWDDVGNQYLLTPKQSLFSSTIQVTQFWSRVFINNRLVILS